MVDLVPFKESDSGEKCKAKESISKESQPLNDKRPKEPLGGFEFCR